MDIKENFRVLLFPDPLTGIVDFEGYEDITSGILNVSTVSGNDIYEGPQQQIDTGEFTIVSRNPNLDPKVNPNLKYNSRIEVAVADGIWINPIFTGYVTNVDVQYVRDDNPIITITGTDLFGVLQRINVNQTLYNEIIALADSPTWDGVDFFTFVSMPEIKNIFTSKYWTDYQLESAIGSGGVGPITANGFWFYNGTLAVNVSGQPYATNIAKGLMNLSEAKYIPQVGETLLEVINKYCSSNLNYITIGVAQGPGSFINIYPFAKYNSDYWKSIQDPYLAHTEYNFSSDPADGAPYEEILLNNGFDRVINQIEVSNEYKTLDGTETVSNTQNFSYVSSDSIEDWAVSKLSIPTIFPESSTLSLNSLTNRFTKSIFQLVSFPENEIQKITIDSARHDSTNFDRVYYKINDEIRVKHKISDTETIDRIYDIAGITHDISPDKWETTFTLKPSIQEVVFNYQGYKPTIQMNSTTGDTNFNFTATIVDYPVEDIQGVIWCLNAPESDPTGTGYISEYAYYYASTINGERYVGGAESVPTGLTVTWNFDDDGILRPIDRIGMYGPENWFGGNGAGKWAVYAYIILKNGFSVVAETYLTVGVPAVEADFVWAQNLTDNFGRVQFTDISVNHEVGEPDSYLWTFGDGTTSTEKNPVKVYTPTTDEHEYEVSLRVFTYGVGGAKVYNTKTYTVTLEQPTMVPDFTWVANYQTIIFTNTSTNVGFEEADAYLWEFGDGTTSTAKNPTHTFPVTDINYPQSFSVKLTTRNIWEQTASITKTITTTALNRTGTFPVRYIKLRIDNYAIPGPSIGYTFRALSPTMSNFKATTSNTGANLSYLKPLTGYSDTNYPLMWNTKSGDSPQVSMGYEYNLTRDPSSAPLTVGLGPNARRFGKTYYYELVIDLGAPTQLVNALSMVFETLYQRGGVYDGYHAEDFYPKISVDFATTITGTTPGDGNGKMPIINGNWVNVGYFKHPPGNGVGTMVMTKVRELPLNIPYFTYTFNDKTVYFTSVETADSYLWTFGDGTTSTDKDPVKTYATYGTKTVTLQVTNGGIVTRTTTEPVVVQAAIL